MKIFNEKAAEKAITDLLIAFGEDINREGLKETPKRVVGYWKELLKGSLYTNQEIADKFSKFFEVGYNPMVVEYIDDLYSHCEHHLALMFDGNCIVGYIPVQNPDGTYKVLGLSKLNRIVELCCKRLQLQEKIASDIAEVISLATGSSLVYVNLSMKHGCVSARGVKSRSFTNVTFMTEELQKNIQIRDEFERKSNEMVLRSNKY